MTEHVLQAGRVAVPYAVLFSDRSAKRRIEVGCDILKHLERVVAMSLRCSLDPGTIRRVPMRGGTVRGPRVTRAF